MVDSASLLCCTNPSVAISSLRSSATSPLIKGVRYKWTALVAVPLDKGEGGGRAKFRTTEGGLWQTIRKHYVIDEQTLDF